MIKCLTGAVIKTLGLLSKSKISDYYWIYAILYKCFEFGPFHRHSGGDRRPFSFNWESAGLSTALLCHGFGLNSCDLLTVISHKMFLFRKKNQEVTIFISTFYFFV
jgi:hypothetical protein